MDGKFKVPFCSSSVFRIEETVRRPITYDTSSSVKEEKAGLPEMLQKLCLLNMRAKFFEQPIEKSKYEKLLMITTYSYSFKKKYM